MFKSPSALTSLLVKKPVEMIKLASLSHSAIQIYDMHKALVLKENPWKVLSFVLGNQP